MPYIMQGIPANLVPHFWTFAEPFIKRALDHTSGEFEPDDMKQLCIDRNIQLWLISKEARIFGAVTTELVVYPHRKHCRVITLAGSDFANWVGIVDSGLTEWAKSHDCDAIESFVRRGLVPHMQPHGYKQKHAVLIKEI